MSRDAAIIGAITLSDTKLLAELIATTELGKMTPLMVAIRKLYSDLDRGTHEFDMLLSHVEHVDARPFHDTALNIAMRKPSDSMSDIKHVRLHVITALLEKGANPHYPNQAGYSPFMIAVHERGDILFAFLSNWKSEYQLALIPQIDDRLLTDFVTHLQMCENGTISLDAAIAIRITTGALIDMQLGKSHDLGIKWFAENFSYPHPIPLGAIPVFINKLRGLIALSGVDILIDDDYAFLPTHLHLGYHIKFMVKLPSSRLVGCILSPHGRFMRFVKVVKRSK